MASLADVLASQSRGHTATSMQTLAAQYGGAVAGIKKGINTVMWKPDGPYGPMYAEWIDLDNNQSTPTYIFTAMGQYEAINFGITGFCRRTIRVRRNCRRRATRVI